MRGIAILKLACLLGPVSSGRQCRPAGYGLFVRFVHGKCIKLCRRKILKPVRLIIGLNPEIFSIFTLNSSCSETSQGGNSLLILNTNVALYHIIGLQIIKLELPLKGICFMTGCISIQKHNFQAASAGMIILFNPRVNPRIQAASSACA